MSTEYHKEVLGQIRGEVASPAYKIPSPAMDALGMVIVDFLPMRSLHCEFPVSALHGGVDGDLALSHIAAASDAAMNLLAAHLTGHPCMAVTSSMHHLRATSVSDGQITVEARVINRVKSIVNLEVRAWNSTGRAIASGEATFTVNKPRPKG